MTLDYIENLSNGTPQYINEHGSIIKPDGFMGYTNHKSFSIADTLLNHFTYYIDDEPNSLVGNDALEIVEKLEELEKSIDKRNMTPTDRAKLDIIDLLLNCYESPDFAYAFGRKVSVMSKENFLKAPEYSNYTEDTDDEKYKSYVKRCIIPEFKDVMVSYLGYDAVEIAEKDKIVSSAIRINERFYNYLLMDYKVIRMPRYKYVISGNKYIISDEGYYCQQKEEEIADEIKTLKLRFPNKEDRKVFFK